MYVVRRPFRFPEYVLLESFDSFSSLCICGRMSSSLWRFSGQRGLQISMNRYIVHIRRALALAVPFVAPFLSHAFVLLSACDLFCLVCSFFDFLFFPVYSPFKVPSMKLFEA